MTFEEAEAILREKSLSWTLDSATFAPLGEHQAIGRVSMGGDTLFVLIERRSISFPVFALEESSLPGLLDWCLKMAAKGNK